MLYAANAAVNVLLALIQSFHGPTQRLIIVSPMLPLSRSLSRLPISTMSESYKLCIKQARQ